jgi:hypothetical protein
MILEVILLLLSQGSAAVELGTAASLFVAKVLTGTWSEQTYGW